MMKFAYRIAGFARSLFGSRPWLGLAAAATVLAPLLLWGQSSAWQFSGGVASVTGVSVGIGTTSPAQKLEVDGGFLVQTGSSAASPAPSLVQHIAPSGHMGGSPGLLAFNSNTTAGNLIVVFITGDAAGTAMAASVTDTQGNNYLPAVGGISNSSQPDSAEIWFAKNIAGGADTVRVTMSSPTQWFNASVAEFTGVDPVSPLDQIAISTTQTGSPYSTGSVTLQYPNELVVAYMSACAQPVPGSGLIPLDSTGWMHVQTAAYKTVASPGAVAATFTTSINCGLGPAVAMASFRPPQTNTSSAPALVVTPAGNVGIGIASPQNSLSVGGSIQAKQIIVTATPADYVFDPKYRLQPLSEVASYVKTNRHLPGIPSGKEVEAKGVSLGDMQSKLLAKVEELTLHMIQEHDRNDRLERQNRELQERIARLEAQRPAAGGALGSR